MKRIMTQLLNIPRVIVENSIISGQSLIFSVSTTSQSAICPNCGQRSRHLNQNQKHLIKDLPMGDKEVILNVNRRRFKCKKCRKKTGRPSKLRVEDQILMTLEYWREYRSYFHLSKSWKIDESNVHRTIRRIEDILIKGTKKI